MCHLYCDFIYLCKKNEGILKKKEKRKKCCTTHDDLTYNARSRELFILARSTCKSMYSL